MPFDDGMFGSALPGIFKEILDRFSSEDVTSAPFGTAPQPTGTLYKGKLKSATDQPIDLGFGELQLPGVTTGIPFRLAVFDSPSGRWHLDLVLDNLSLKLKDLQGADFVKENGTVPRRLVRRTQDTAVVISGEATIRFARASDADPVVVLFVDSRNAGDPLAQTGAVVDLRCTPPHFFFGSSQFAMTLSEMLFDGSDSYSPGFVTGLGQGPEWIGFALAEATFYAPPNALGQGGFSGGVRNLLIGAPRGLQGELEVQWGATPLDPATFRFTQTGLSPIGATGSGQSRLVAITAGQDQAVQVAVALAAAAPPQGGSWQATWRWPDGSETQGDNSAGQVRHGEVLHVTPEEQLTGGTVLRHPEISFRFIASGAVPLIDVTTPAGPVTEAIHVAGPAAQIAGLSFTARSTAPTPGSFSWKLGEAGTDRPGASVTLGAAELSAETALILKESAGGIDRVTRLRIQQVEGRPLLIGGRLGVVDASAPASALTPEAVEGSYDLVDFHSRGHFRPVFDSARLDATTPAGVAVPDGALAIVTLASGGAAPVVDYDRHIQILFEYAKGVPISWGDLAPVGASAAGSEADLHPQLLRWAAKYPGATFLVVGRCDDIGSDDYNDGLAQSRCDTARRLLTTVPAGTALTAVTAMIIDWPEHKGQRPGVPATSPLTAQERAPLRLINVTTDQTGWPVNKRDTKHACEKIRLKFRRVDIYALDGTPAAGAVRQEISPGRAPDRRRMMLPGADVAPVPVPTATPDMDYRVKLLVGWDKPQGDGFKDLIPSKAEFEFAWTPGSKLPPLGDKPVDMGTEVYTIYGSWAHDDATGLTRSQVGMRSDGDPDGLIKFDQAPVVATFALGPVLLSGVNSGTDTFERAGRISALAAGIGVANFIIRDGSKAVLKKVEANARIGDLDAPGNDWKVTLVSDYTTALNIDTGAMGLKTDPAHPVAFRYKNVGLKFDQSKSNWWDKLGVEYPTDALEIEDPGKWQLDGVLGKLLRAVETAMGRGSLWIEGRFAFALSIGVVEITEAAIRVTFDGGPPAFSLRGLVARVNIPKTVEGEGRLRIEKDGVIKAGVDLKIIPIKMTASAAFAMAPKPDFTFINLFAKVQFPVGIPLGGTGCAIHGFIGQTVINGKRLLSNETDIVKREIGWWQQPPENKYDPIKGQHALGLGAVVGTLPDASFSVSAQGMIVVAFPDPEVIFGVEVKLLKVPDKGAKEQGGDQNATIIGLIVIDDTAVSMAVSARYEIPKVLKVTAPFAAYFPYSLHGVYVRLGSDGQMGRAGEPVTLSLLPGTLDLKAYSYLMIEQDGLLNLGGRPDFSFQGFSVGFGAGAGLEWSAGPIKLSASVLLLAGFGTDPLLIKAGIFVKGELDLVVISVVARGQIVLTYQDGAIWLDGEFCGKVDLFFFSIEGCVTFRIGSPAALTVAPPPAPVASVSLIDRGGRVMGEAAPAGTALQAQPIFRMTEVNGKMQNTGAAPRDNNSVWADTAPVINFRHFMQNAVSGGQFNLGGQPSGEEWFGSNRLKYRYRLDGVRLVRVADGTPVAGLTADPLQAAWVTSPVRQPIGGDSAASGAEVQSLKLLDWTPWDWALPMTDGGASAPGDPAETVKHLCDPLPQPARACLYGRFAREAGLHRIRLLHETPPPGPYASHFTLTGRPAILRPTGLVETPALIALAAASGALVLPGAVIDLPQPVAGPAGPLSRGYRLPEAQITSATATSQTALPWIADLDRSIRRGRLLLLVCDGLYTRPPETPRNCYAFEGLATGKDYAALDLPGYQLRALDSAQPFSASDGVDLAQGSPLPGSDRQTDIRFGFPGLAILPQNGAQSLELYLYRPFPDPLTVKWADQGGQSQSLTPADATGNLVLQLTSATPIVQIEIATRAKQVFLYRICETGTGVQSCFTFADAKSDAVATGSFSYAGVDFAAVDPRIGLRLTDWVDAGATPPVRGQDRVPELAFPDKGLELKPAQPWASVTLGVLSGGGPVIASGFDAAGNLVAQAQDPARDPVELHLSHGPGLARVTLSGGSNEAVLWRVCQGEAGGETCFGFDRLKDASERLELNGLTLTPLVAGERIEPMDVLTDSQPVLNQADGRSELLLPPGGLSLVADAPLAGATLYIAPLGGERIEVTAFDASGAQVAQAQGGGTADALERLVLRAAAMTRIEIQAGGKSFLTRICTTPAAQDGTGTTTGGALPVVQGRLGGRAIAWTPSQLSSFADGRGGTCRLVAYDQPPELTDTAGFEIVTRQGSRVTLLSLCGVDSRADQARDKDQAAQDGLKGNLGTAAAPDAPPSLRQILLDPGQDYRIEVDWSWQSWSSNEAGTDTPYDPGASFSAWTSGAQQAHVFRIAAEDLEAGATQDGLNEYKFDPRDISRYLDRTEPADGRDVVFTDDPLWVHFSAGHVEALVDRYGRKLALEVKRTDPPPQASANALRQAMRVAQLREWRVKGPASVQNVVEQRINAALAEAPCLPDGPALGGMSLGGKFKLAPNAMYDFNLIAPKKTPAGSDPVQVNATRFKTSRYAGPRQMLEALGFALGKAAPIGPAEIVLAPGMVLPSGPLSVSDMDLMAALSAIGADTLPLPGEQPRTIAIWQNTGTAYGVAGVLVDAPEPMRRERAVLVGQQAQDSLRCAPAQMTIGSRTFLPVRATLNWTRVLFVAASPVVPPVGAELRLRLTVAPGSALIGRRSISARPVMLETEGF